LSSVVFIVSGIGGVIASFVALYLLKKGSEY